MSFRNYTYNQHFVSRAEQRLNSIDPTRHRDRQKIYQFSIQKTDPPELTSEGAHRIKNTLSADDLYSFDILTKGERLNFEHQFGIYERDITKHTKSLLTKARNGNLDLKAEFVDLFAAKLLNVFRNPYSIDQTLNTLQGIDGLLPLEPSMVEAHQKITNARQRHASQICHKYGLTMETYERWLKALLLILGPRKQLNLFETVIVGMFNHSVTAVQIFEYDETHAENVCLLSDRGINYIVQDGKYTQFAFNLSSRAFAIYAFAKLDEQPQFQAIAARHGLKVDDLLNGRGQLTFGHHLNRVEELKSFNRHTVEYAAKHVFASHSQPRLT